MKERLKKVLQWVLKKLPLSKTILLEAIPVFGDNTGALYRYMLQEHWNDEWKLVWLARKKEEYRNPPKIKNVIYLARDQKLDAVRLFFFRCRAAAIIDCNTQVPKLNPKTFHFYLTHGSLMKNVKEYRLCDATTDCILNQSPFFEEINVEGFHVAKDQLVTCGFPRNDELWLGKKVKLRCLLGQEYSKIAVWYPTYRQMKSSDRRVSDISIPIIHDVDAAKRVNEIALQFNSLIMVKPHPAQDLSFIKDLQLSNLRFINNQFIEDLGLKPYEFLGATDLLITDYSSVFYDYLLTGNPVALTFEDADQYSVNPGFAVDVKIITSCSYMLDAPEDFEAVFKALCLEEDPLAEVREQITALTNFYRDENSSERTAQYIKERILNQCQTNVE